jgi:predicted nucleic acid-binding Zn ribbon protein
VSAENSPDGVELACAFVLSRTGVAGEVALKQPPRRRRRGRAPAEPADWSGPAPGPRDPVAAGSVLDVLVATGGWSDRLAVHSVTGRWAQIVGPAVAEHTSIEAFAEGVLTVRCDSTAWATQMRMLVPQLHARLNDEAGAGVVRTIEVKGPDAPSWVHGPRRVKGRGPRDTYG